MANLTLSDLLKLSRPSGNITPPAGYIPVPADTLILPKSNQEQRIDYHGFYNPQTNQIIIMGTAKPQPLGGLVESEPKIADGGIFWDTTRVTRGPNAGAFLETPVPVKQTQDLANELTTRRDAAYPNASITFVGEGAVGLAFSASSYNLRTDTASTVTVDNTVTVNSWQGRWTADGKTDTGVLDVRTPNPITGDPVFGVAPTATMQAEMGWSPGGVVVNANTGNAQLASGAADVVSQTAVDAISALLSKGAGSLANETLGWLLDKAIDKGTDPAKEAASDAAANAAGNWVDSPSHMTTQLGWQAKLSPSDALRVLNEGITQQQWNVMNGVSPSGYAVDSVHYEPVGNPQTIGTGPNAQTSQSVVQVRVIKDPETGAIMEVRVPGKRIDGDQFEITGAPFSIGMNASGQVIQGTPLPSGASTDTGIGIDNLGQVGNTAFENLRRNEIAQQNNTAPDGQPYGTTVQTAPNASQTWDKTSQPGLVTRTQDVHNGDGSTTRIVTDVDTATGKPVSERIYENTHSANNPNAPDSFNLVGIYDAATGQRQSINRETGLMEPVQGSAPTYYHSATVLPNAPANTSEGSTPNYVVQPGDIVDTIAVKLGLTPAQYSDYLKSVYGPNADLNSIMAGRELPVPANAPYAGSNPHTGGTPTTEAPSADNDYQTGGSNGEAEAAAYIASQNNNAGTTNAAFEQLVDAFNNIDTSQAGPGVQLADAGNSGAGGGVVSDAGGGGGSTGTSASNPALAQVEPTPAAIQTIANSPVATPNPGTPQDLLAYLDGPGASLSPAQQYALATQLGHLGLGAVDGNTLSLHSLPGGGALLANADGDIVGEVSVAPNGALHLQGNMVNADGSTSPADVHVTGSGQVMTPAQYQDAQFNAAANDAAGALSLVNSLANLAHFDQLTDLGKAQSLLSLYNQIDGLGSATAALTGSTDVGGNLPGNLGQWGAGLSLITALQGNDPIAQASAAGAFYNTFASSSTSIPIPYLQALNLIGAIESGNTVSMVASAVAFIPGWGTAASIAISIIAPLLADKPPPPEGATHYEWDASGNIQIHVDFNQSHGGEMAQRTAQSVQGLLESIVQSINDQTPDTSDDVAINPYLLPRVGFSQSGGAWIEMTTPDGGSYREMIQGNNQSQGLAQRLFELLTENGGIAPAWQVQTQLGHMQQLLDQGAGQGEIAAQLGAGAGGHAYHGNQAYAIEGNATESADFKTQSFGALVVHLGAGVVASDAVQASTQALQDLQAQQADHKVATSELYRDTEGDGYYEKTQWVSATDAQGHVQGLLVLDYNGNGQIETRDILNLGGNAGQEGNLANDALAASANAHLQRNNVEWLDANGDHVLDARDPAFAAIKLWVDLNQDARLDAGEQADLASLQITSINFTTGEVTYADGHRDALSSTTLQSDTDGVRYTQMQEADAEGNLHTINAGQMLEHEGYQGQVQVVDQGGVTRWGTVREATFEQDALRTGDWEGTAEQDQHRHGGANVASAPTQTSATGAASLGEVKRTGGQTTGQGQMLTDRRVVFVPAIATLGQERTDSPTDQMVRSAQEGALAGGMGAGLGALAMVGLGAVQTTAFAAPDAERVHGGYADDVGLDATARTAAVEAKYAALPDTNRAHTGDVVPAAPAQGTWQEEPRRIVDAPPPPGVLADVDALQRAGLDLSAYAAAHTSVREIRATLVSSGVTSTSSVDSATAAAATPASAEMLLDLPKVAGEVLAGTEDTVLRIGTELLLANDSTANADAPLHISAVGNASHGQVSLQTSVNGAGQTVTEVVFLPDADFYGTASFSYTVTDPYGLSSTATATLLVENVNDAPYAQGEVVSGASEDATFLIDKAVLLANDGDVDDAPSALGIGWVGNAVHGTVSLDANGNVVFTPGLNFNGNAEFEYMTVDAAGLLSPAVQVVMPVAAVNDAPLAVDDQFQTYVNSTMTIGFAQLMGNDTDIENDTLNLVDVGNASHGVVSIVNGQVEFVPTAGFTGAASFDYLADDGNGGQTWATAFVEVKPPPNLYASVNLYGASFYGTGGNSGWRIDMADVSFAVSDDGDTAFSSVALQSLSVLRTDFSRPESDADGTYYPYYAWQSMAGVNAFSYNNTYMNLDVQRGYGFTDFHSTWRITDDRGLTNIWHLNYSVSGGATSYMEYSGYVGPVVLSLDGSDPSYISTQYSQVRYDMDMDGIADKVAWAAPGSGVLGIDLNGDHQISNASEFAFKQYVDGAQTDLEGLRAFDTNHNGLLDAGDAQWSQFGVWEDKNADGQTQDGEYLTLDALGVATINLQSNAQMHSGATAGGGTSTDVTVMGDTTFTRTDGSTGVAADAMLAYQSGVYAQAAEADLARMALLFNQMANTAVTQDVEPLGFVPLQPVEATMAHEELLALQAA